MRWLAKSGSWVDRQTSTTQSRMETMALQQQLRDDSFIPASHRRETTFLRLSSL